MGKAALTHTYCTRAHIQYVDRYGTPLQWDFWAVKVGLDFPSCVFQHQRASQGCSQGNTEMIFPADPIPAPSNGKCLIQLRQKRAREHLCRLSEQFSILTLSQSRPIAEIKLNLANLWRNLISAILFFQSLPQLDRLMESLVLVYLSISCLFLLSKWEYVLDQVWPPYSAAGRVAASQFLGLIPSLDYCSACPPHVCVGFLCVLRFPFSLLVNGMSTVSFLQM